MRLLRPTHFAKIVRIIVRIRFAIGQILLVVRVVILRHSTQNRVNHLPIWFVVRCPIWQIRARF